MLIVTECIHKTKQRIQILNEWSHTSTTYSCDTWSTNTSPVAI